VDSFEKAIAEFTGAPYAVAVESCSSALFLCMKYLGVTKETEIILPKFTYVSVAAQVVHAGARIKFSDIEWQEKGYYKMDPLPLYDAACRLTRGMWRDTELNGNLACLSFHDRKPLKIGRGGMILCRTKEEVEWFEIARFDGRHKCPQMQDTYAMAGWNVYMTPSQAARGFELLQWFGDGLVREYDPYPDLSVYKFFTEANR
jgi:dTDP-4-amino-4,6-dideoxygalactose transaminase